jgi:hypothetical protein
MLSWLLKCDGHQLASMYCLCPVPILRMCHISAPTFSELNFSHLRWLNRSTRGTTYSGRSMLMKA